MVYIGGGFLIGAPGNALDVSDEFTTVYCGQVGGVLDEVDDNDDDG